jgi:hypothetical protein
MRVKEKALETSTQRVQTMLETYLGTNLGQFPNGHTNLENVSSPTANFLPAKHCPLTLLLFLNDGCKQNFTNLGLVTRMTSGNVARPPVAAAAATSNQQTTMKQHYRARSQRQSLPSGWIELMDAASSCPCYFHGITSRMVFSKAEIFKKKS